jgi:peptidoglycan/LPS O-acetylase OafA/YrhL
MKYVIHAIRFVLNIAAIVIPALFLYAASNEPDWDQPWWPVYIYGILLSLAAFCLGFAVTILKRTSKLPHWSYVPMGLLTSCYGIAIFISNANGGGPIVFYVYCICFLLMGSYLLVGTIGNTNSNSTK